MRHIYNYTNRQTDYKKIATSNNCTKTKYPEPKVGKANIQATKIGTFLGEPNIDQKCCSEMCKGQEERKTDREKKKVHPHTS